MLSNIFFIGNKKRPNFMIELDKSNKLITVYKPDIYSLKCKDYIEKYILGEIIYQDIYNKLFFMKDNLEDFKEYYSLLSEIIIQTADKYIYIKNNTYERSIN